MKKKPKTCTLTLIDEFCLTSKCEMLISAGQEEISSKSPASYKCKLTKGLEGANGLLSVYQEGGISELLSKAQSMPVEEMRLALTAAIIKLTSYKHGENESKPDPEFPEAKPGQTPPKQSEA